MRYGPPGLVLVTTRIVLLAHWFTDVAVGLALGVGVKRCIRLVTKPKQSRQTTSPARPVALLIKSIDLAIREVLPTVSFAEPAPT
jgi:hypothetical protein